MIPTGKTFDILVALVFCHKPLKVLARKKIHQLREDITTLMHILPVCDLLTECKLPQR
jgi:hypothetical protein